MNTYKCRKTKKMKTQRSTALPKKNNNLHKMASNLKKYMKHEKEFKTMTSRDLNCARE